MKFDVKNNKEIKKVVLKRYPKAQLSYIGIQSTGTFMYEIITEEGKQIGMGYLAEDAWMDAYKYCYMESLHH